MTNSLKAAMCASLVLGSVFSGFASEDPAEQVLEQVQATGDFMANAGKAALAGAKKGSCYLVDQAGNLAGKAGNGLKQVGNAVLAKGSDVLAQAKESQAYAAASEKASDIYTLASEKALHAYALASDKAAQGYAFASDKAILALNWAENKTPEGVKAWIANHPYLSLTAVVAPIALFIGYKLGKRKPVKRG